MKMQLAMIAVVGLLATACAQGDQQPVRKMAVTFDDLPFVTHSIPADSARRESTIKLVTALDTRDIPTTGFVNEGKLHEDGQPIDARTDLLRIWLDNGMLLGNHSWSHLDLHEVTLEEMQADVVRGAGITRPLLQKYGHPLDYFRHPYLHTGRDLQTKQTFEEFLDDNGYRVAPVSIDNSEWIFARAYMLALRDGDRSLAERIGEDYVSYMLEMVDFYEDQSAQLFDRNISHVLLVHANELNSDWFGVLADRLSELGYEFISLDEALEDPVYGSEDTYTGRGGITWIHRWAITRDVDRAIFRGEPTTPEYVLELTRLPEHNY